MYKYLLCWRYLRTRYIALASVVSVMLGVATMIVVNAVMAGFSSKMRERLHGVLADVVVESVDLDGFYDVEGVLATIKATVGDKVEAMAPTMETFALMKVLLPNGKSFTRQVQVMGVRPEERAQTGDFSEYLFRRAREGEEVGEAKPDGLVAIPPSFEVPPALRRAAAGSAGILPDGDGDPMFKVLEEAAQDRVPDHGAIIGYALATIHQKGMPDFFIAPEGTKIILTFMRGGRRPEPGHDSFTVTGFFKSGMSEYDAMHVYVPLERLQEVRNLVDRSGRGASNQIQIKAAPGVDIDALARTIQAALEPGHPMSFRVSTWEEKQGPLLAAVALEQGILNILLFFIIAVAGFGILAIFFMIVVEKTRDIGILKSLGASTRGVRGIFLGYGLSLGLVGSGVGMIGGLLFVTYINPIESLLSKITGRKVFDDEIYYFDTIPTLIEWPTVAAIVGGALLIAVVASVWPAQRAAKLHPVRALRFE